MFHFLKLSWIIAVLLFASCGVTADTYSKDKLISELDNLKISKIAVLGVALDKSKDLLASAQLHADKQSIVKAVLIQAEILKKLERYQEAQELLDTYSNRIESLDDPTFNLRADLLRLALLDNAAEFDKSKQLTQKIISKIKRASQNELVARSYLEVGYSYYLDTGMDKAIEFYNKAYEIYFRLNEESGLADVFNSLSLVYGEQGDKNLAVNYLKKALAIYSKLGYRHAASLAHYNLGFTYVDMGLLEEAKSQFSASIEISLDIDDKLNLAYSKSALARIFIKQSQFVNAANLYKESIAIFKYFDDEVTSFRMKVGLLESYIGSKDKIAAGKLFNKLQIDYAKYGQPGYPSKFLLISARYHELMMDYKRAFETQLDYSQRLLKNFDRVQEQDVEKLMVEFDSKIKESENLLLLKDNEVKKLRLEQQNSRLFFLILVAVMAILIVVVIGFLLYRQTLHRTRFQKMALRDHLTNAPNRRAVLQYAKERFSEARQTNMNFTIALVDLDHFKTFNDQYGHDVGDEVLKSFSNACASALRKQDRYGRYGGEEWLLVLGDTDKNEVTQIFNRLKANLEKISINGVEKPLTVLFSMGVAQYDPDTDKNVQDMIRRADSNLYEAKGMGRDRVIQ
ncbi:GGDEF domain-containing protein [Psychrosphaera sp. B3R10]|uniref:tetratricopeptide repeat-containing diguanylate cyclase n=1 Tax=unclassified Psychrosphaera TaxID=2641570 RepID=UPI001C08A738|nr:MULTISPECIES: tetratricopeptide repeat-containing diguanylate cyclase [unclassified Psychrosphaera]MBU2880585.1 GGDEF domain-containing protein [Psychrosphaera sp. I2R16]MBU2990671.1 GGDEF domain-containing protein [Psychrosphaera sp. B3R10]